MPTYEYRCDQCDRSFDVVQSFHDDALTECPTCGAPVRKLFGNVGIVFKGSGFYKTDSRSGGPSKASSGTDATSTSDNGTGGGDGSGSSKEPDSSKGAGAPKGSDGASSSPSTSGTDKGAATPSKATPKASTAS